MKRKGNLYQDICIVENLRQADINARKGKKNKYGVILFDKDPEGNILALNKMLINKTFIPSPYSRFWVYEPKEREVFRLPYFPDQIIQHAIMIYLKPILKSMFIAQTYSGIEGRGVHKAVYDLEKGLKDIEATEYCLQLDVQKFYPSVNHQVLKRLLRRKIKDENLLWLLGIIIDSAPGIPIGNFLSQYFANFYLTAFDIWLKSTMKVKRYYRYMDDMVILASNKPYLHNLFAKIQEYLNEELKLTVKKSHQIYPVSKRGINFGGYRSYHRHRMLRKYIKKRFARMLARRRNKASIASYMGWAKHANTKHLIKKLLPNESVQRLRNKSHIQKL